MSYKATDHWACQYESGARPSRILKTLHAALLILCQERCFLILLTSFPWLSFFKSLLYGIWEGMGLRELAVNFLKETARVEDA